MNIFILDECPRKSAQMMNDKHVVKMILESAQMLCTAHRVLDGVEDDELYKTTHINHPCNAWIRESSANYMWLYAHFKALSEEYTYRYDKVHKTWQKLGIKLAYIPINCPRGIGLTPFPIAMKQYSDCIVDDAVSSYRNYYKVAKRDFSKWTKRNPPYWWNTEEIENAHNS